MIEIASLEFVVMLGNRRIERDLLSGGILCKRRTRPRGNSSLLIQ